jgi:hypothetical protein
MSSLQLMLLKQSACGTQRFRWRARLSLWKGIRPGYFSSARNKDSNDHRWLEDGSCSPKNSCGALSHESWFVVTSLNLPVQRFVIFHVIFSIFLVSLTSSQTSPLPASDLNVIILLPACKRSEQAHVFDDR